MPHFRTAVAVLIAGLVAAGTASAQSTGSQPTPQPGPAKSGQPADSARPGASPGAPGSIGTPRSGSAPGPLTAPVASKADIRRAQEALKSKGHDPGPIDGVVGPKTRAAIESLQKAENIQVSGRLDEDTKAKLEVN